MENKKILDRVILQENFKTILTFPYDNIPPNSQISEPRKQIKIKSFKAQEITLDYYSEYEQIKLAADEQWKQIKQNNNTILDKLL